MSKKHLVALALTAGLVSTTSFTRADDGDGGAPGGGGPGGGPGDVASDHGTTAGIADAILGLPSSIAVVDQANFEVSVLTSLESRDAQEPLHPATRTCRSHIRAEVLSNALAAVVAWV